MSFHGCFFPIGITCGALKRRFRSRPAQMCGLFPRRRWARLKSKANDPDR